MAEEKKEQPPLPPKQIKSAFSEIRKFNDDSLKPTETVVRHLVTIVDKGKTDMTISYLDIFH